MYEDKLRVHCTCGNVYITSLDSLTLTSIPPVYQERGRNKCSQCGMRYINNHNNSKLIIKDVFME